MHNTYYALRDSEGRWYRRDRKWGKREDEWHSFGLDSLFTSKAIAEFVRDDCETATSDVRLVTFVLSEVEESSDGADRRQQ